MFFVLFRRQKIIGFWQKNTNFVDFLNFFNKFSKPLFYLVPDSYSRAQTRESVESAKKGLEYESFEYESRLDTALNFTRGNENTCENAKLGERGGAHYYS